MAITMPKEGDFVGLGPFGIIREAHKLWSTHFKFFSFIQLFFILPFAIAVMVSQAPWLQIPPEEGRPGPTTDQNGITNSITNGGMDFIEYLLTVIIANSSVSDVATVRIQWLLLFCAVGVMFIAAYAAVASLFTSAIVHAVRLHYTGQSFSLGDVLKVTIPRLWMRLTITNLYSNLLLSFILMLGFGGFMILKMNKAPVEVLVLEVVLSMIMIIIGIVILDMMFMVAGSVSVLEMDYGWAAVRRSLKLLKGKVGSALLFQLIWLVPLGTLGAFHQRFGANITPGAGFEANSGVNQLIFGALYISYQTYFWLLKALCTGIQYATFKAYHEEDVEEAMLNLGSGKGGYERVESTDDNGGQLSAGRYV
ncbi:unnamed protein product [Calypogeia fissa]